MQCQISDIANAGQCWLITFDGVGMSIVNDVGGAERLAVSVEVNGGRSQSPELWEELVDVGVGDPEVQVGDDELGRAERLNAATSRGELLK